MSTQAKVTPIEEKSVSIPQSELQENVVYTRTDTKAPAFLYFVLDDTLFFIAESGSVLRAVEGTPMNGLGRMFTYAPKGTKITIEIENK